ncbi:MAG: hypothetical protein NUW37_14535 [Planctomycetes bacterium]|nr:hypothetical protein [Planctomycetota bacterium]
MFIVKNLLKSTLMLKDLKLQIGPREYMDLDKAATRMKVNLSKSLQMALDEGYLFVVKCDQKTQETPQPKRFRFEYKEATHAGGANDALMGQIEELKKMLITAPKAQPATSGVAQSAGPGVDMSSLLSEMRKGLDAVARAAKGEDDFGASMDEVQIKARLAALGTRKSDVTLEGDVEKFGKKTESDGAAKMADLLDDI